MKTHRQMKDLKARLLQEQQDLTALSDATSEDRAPVMLDQQSVGRLSRMDAMQQQSMDIAREERRQRRLKVLNAALQRIETDDYGYCLACGEDIAMPRLEADPAATRCLDCMKNS